MVAQAMRDAVYLQNTAAMQAERIPYSADAVAFCADGPLPGDGMGGFFRWDGSDATAPDNVNTFRNNNQPSSGLYKRVSFAGGAQQGGPTDIEESLAITGVISPAQITTNVDNYAPAGLATAADLRLSTDATRDITGIAGGADGRLLMITNVGADNIVLKDENAASLAANRFALTADVTMPPDAKVVLSYDNTASRWRVVGVSLASAALVPVEDAAGNFVGENVEEILAELQDNIDVGSSSSASARPEDFGAVGDGVANETSALLSAIATGKDVELTKGKTYLLDTWTAIDTINLTLIGNGATIKGPSTRTSFYRPQGRILIDNVGFERWENPIQEVIPSPLSAVSGRISRCKFDDCTGIAINIETPANFLAIVHNEVDGAVSSPHIGIRIGENDNTLQSGWVSCTVAHNKITNLTTTGTIDCRPILLYGQNHSIHHNYIQTIRSADAACNGIYTKQIGGDVSFNIVVDVNSTGSTGDYLDVSGISLKGLYMAGVGVSPKGYHTKVLGNTLKFVGTTADRGFGIRSQNEANIIADNTVLDAGLVGIYDNDNGRYGSIIKGNIVQSLSAITTYGIWKSGNTNGGIIQSNRIIHTVHAVRLDGETNPLYNTLITNNTIESHQTNASALYFGSSSITRVAFDANIVQVQAASSAVIRFHASSAVSGLSIQNNNVAAAIALSASMFSGSKPSDTVIENNIGYITRNSGVAIIPAGGGTNVAHGLPGVPAHANLTPYQANVAVTWQTRDATNINIIHPAGWPVEVSWEAWL